MQKQRTTQVSIDKMECPKCHKSFPISEAISHQMQEQIHEIADQQAEQRISKEKALWEKEKMEIGKNATASAEDRFKTEISNRDQELKLLKKANQEHTEDLANQREQWEKEKQQIEKKAKADAETKLQLDIKNRESELKELKETKVAYAQKELAWLKEKRKIEDEKSRWEIEKQQAINEESAKIREEESKKATEKTRTEVDSLRKTLSDTQKHLDEAQRKAAQGSQQTQGEIAELALEELIKTAFPHDKIDPVPKGVPGADVLQQVCSPSGLDAGLIVWESKNTKLWSEKWITKIKDDQRESKAEIAVIVSKVLPKEIERFGFRDGIWITDCASVTGLAMALRMNLIQLAHTKKASVGKNEKLEILYSYLSGPEFRHRIEAIVESFTEMKKDLDEEKRAFAKKWAKSEKQIEKVVANTAGMYGDMQAIVALPNIRRLGLPAAVAS